MKLNFGKYKGQEIDDVPVQYLHWIICNVNNLDSDTDLAILKSFRSRQDEYNLYQIEAEEFGQYIWDPEFYKD